MCHNSGIESEQIERYMAFGLPQKAVRSVKYTMRKREKQQRKEQQRKEQQSQQTHDASNSTNNNYSNNNSSGSGSEGSDSDSGNDFDIKPTLLMQEQEQVQQPTEESATVTAVTELVTADETPMATTEAKASAAEATHINSGSVNKSNNTSILQIPKFCGRFRKMQQEQANAERLTTATTAAAETTTPTAETTAAATASAALTAQQQRKMSSMEPSMDDALAIGTQMTRKFADRCYCLVDKLQASRLYIILTRTTQPAHLIAICILSFVLLTVGPDLTTTTAPATTTTTTTTTTIHSSQSTLPTQAQNVGAGANDASSTLPTLAYLGAFATHFGSQIWMTFVSGLSLYFSLPRHTFGQCQQILFPKYFALNAMLSITMLIIYVKYFLSGWTTASGVQLGILMVTAAIEVVVRLYLAPPMLRLMHEKYRIEGAIGSGQEVGSLVQGDLVECPHYQRIHKNFRRIHMTIAIGNMIILLATCLQLYFLASKIHIS